MMIVHPDNSVLKRASDAMGAPNVSGPNRRTETKVRIVCQFDRMRLIGKWNHHDDGPKYLFSSATHRVVHARQNCGFDVVPGGEVWPVGDSPAADDGCAFSAANLDVPKNPFSCRCADHRTELSVGISRVTDADLGGLRDECLDELVVNSVLDQYSASTNTGLSSSDEPAEGDALGRDLDVLVVEHDDR